MRRIHLLLLHLAVSSLGQEFSSIDCTFQHTLCGWEAEPPWTLTETTFLPSPLNLNPIMLIGDGSFMTAQGHFGSNTTADLVSPLMEPSPILSILSLKYTKAVGSANLQIIIKEGTSYRILDTITTNSLVLWIRRTLVVPATVEPYQIVFRVSKLRDGFDTISVDDVMLRTATGNVMSADPMNSHGQLTQLTESRELRRSPTPVGHFNVIGKRQDTAPRCKIKCSFEQNACTWSLSKWKLLNGKIITEAQSEAWLESEPVLLPMNAHFELDMSMSDSSSLAVYQKFGAEENLIWTQSGIPLAGWNRIRLPIRFSPLPSKFLIKTSTRQGQSIALTNTNIVDESGRDLACGGDLEVIRPRSDTLIRLTAIQKLDAADQATAIPKLFVVSTTPSASRPRLALSPPSSSYGGAFAFASDPQNAVSSPFAALPISPAKVMSNTLQIPSPLLYSRQLSAGIASKGAKEAHRVPATTSSAPIVALTRKPSMLQELMARQPLLKELLKHLSKKYGFEDIPDDQALQRLPQIQRLLAGFNNVERHPGKRSVQPLNFGCE